MISCPCRPFVTPRRGSIVLAWKARSSWQYRDLRNTWSFSRKLSSSRSLWMDRLQQRSTANRSRHDGLLLPFWVGPPLCTSSKFINANTVKYLGSALVYQTSARTAMREQPNALRFPTKAIMPATRRAMWLSMCCRETMGHDHGLAPNINRRRIPHISMWVWVLLPTGGISLVLSITPCGQT